MTTSTYAIAVHLVLGEEPAGPLVLTALEALNGRISGLCTSAEGLGNSAARVGEAEASSWRVQAASAACLGGFQTLLDSGQLHLKPGNIWISIIHSYLAR